MFEAYNAAIRLSQSSRLVMPLYALTALDMQDLGLFKMIRLVKSLQPDDGLSYVQRFFRDNAKNKHSHHDQNRQPHQNGAGPEDHKQDPQRERHLMPEQWRSWPLRAVESMVLDPGDPCAD
jgi:hypothetical protein